MWTYVFAIAGLVVGCIVFGLLRLRMEKEPQSHGCGCCQEDADCATSCSTKSEKDHRFFG